MCYRTLISTGRNGFACGVTKVTAKRLAFLYMHLQSLIDEIGEVCYNILNFTVVTKGHYYEYS